MPEASTVPAAAVVMFGKYIYCIEVWGGGWSCGGRCRTWFKKGLFVAIKLRLEIIRQKSVFLTKIYLG